MAIATTEAKSMSRRIQEAAWKAAEQDRHAYNCLTDEARWAKIRRSMRTSKAEHDAELSCTIRAHIAEAVGRGVAVETQDDKHLFAREYLTHLNETYI